MVFERVSKECHSVRLCLRNFANLFVCCKRCWLPLTKTWNIWWRVGRNMNLMNSVYLFCFDVVRTVASEPKTMIYGGLKPKNARSDHIKISSSWCVRGRWEVRTYAYSLGIKSNSKNSLVPPVSSVFVCWMPAVSCEPEKNTKSSKRRFFARKIRAKNEFYFSFRHFLACPAISHGGQS